MFSPTSIRQLKFSEERWEFIVVCQVLLAVGQKMHLDMVHFLHYANMAHKRYKISVDSYVVNYCIMYTFSEYVWEMQTMSWQYIKSHYLYGMLCM